MANQLPYEANRVGNLIKILSIKSLEATFCDRQRNYLIIRLYFIEDNNDSKITVRITIPIDIFDPPYLSFRGLIITRMSGEPLNRYKYHEKCGFI